MQIVKHYSEFGDDPVIVMNKWYLLMMVGTKLAVLGCNTHYTWLYLIIPDSAEIPPKSYRRTTICKNSADFLPS